MAGCQGLSNVADLEDEWPADEPGGLDEGASKKSTAWYLLGLGVLLVALVWIILGVWRYLHVLGYGSP